MARNHDDRCWYPLYNREIYYGECYEVQEVRGDEMELKWLREPFDRAQADEVCTRCRWYVVSGRQ